MLHSSTLTFLKALKKNNNKVWFDKNKEKYLSARADFETFANSLLQKLISFDTDLKDLEIKKCLYRINRDVRFSKNKAPYKINISGYFSKGGKKSVFAGYYFHLQPGNNSFVGGGLWAPEASSLKKVRQEIDYCFPEFKRIVHSGSFSKHFGNLTKDAPSLVNVPRGYEKDNPAAEFLKLKSYVVSKKIPDSSLLQPGLSDEVAASLQTLKPLIKFINRSLD